MGETKEQASREGFYDKDIKYTDVGGSIGYGDVVRDFFDFLPFLNDATVLQVAPGRQVRADKIFRGLSFEEQQLLRDRRGNRGRRGG
jgi:hypothetical protein